MPLKNQKMEGNKIPLHHVSINHGVQLEAVAVYRTRSFRLEDPIPENPPDGTEGFIFVRVGRHEQEYHLVYRARAFQWILKEDSLVRGFYVGFVNQGIIDHLRMKLGTGDRREDDIPDFRARRVS